MFGISLAEFLLILIVAVLVIGPKDLPEVARYIIKAFAQAKLLITNVRAELKILGQEIGIDEIKNDLAVELANEKTRIESEITTIIDLYGNEHKIACLEDIRKDKSRQEIGKEIDELNQKNIHNSSKNPS
jgi:Tat protein translocase TatB subunit